MITEKRVLELKEWFEALAFDADETESGCAKAGRYCDAAALCDLALRAIEGEKREVPRFRFHWEFKGDKVELTTPVDPAGQWCLFSDVAALRSSPVDRAQGECAPAAEVAKP